MNTRSGSAADRVMGEQARLLDKYGPKDLEVVTEVGEPESVRTTNRQRHGNEGLQGAGWHGEKSANLQILEQKSQHTIIIYLKARGMSNREIAVATGYTDSWVSQVTRQPWFKKQLAETLREAGIDPVKNFLQCEALPALEALAAVRDNPEAPSAARVAACNAILDRAFGKPTQHIQSESTVNVNNAKKSVEQIEQELSSIDEQLKSRGQRPINS